MTKNHRLQNYLTPIGNRVSRAVRTSSQRADHLRHALEDRTDLAVRRNPWRAIGVAFTSGLLLAGTAGIIAAALRRQRA